MEKTTKILVPIDFSACSENALLYAIRLASTIKANITVLNVPPLNTSTTENPYAVQLLVEERNASSRRNLTKSIKKTTESMASVGEEMPTIETKIVMGEVEGVIADEAAKNQANYIIMGTQGENSTLDKYLGSVASNVLRDAPCPVMVIPEYAKLSDKVVMGYATDFSDADPFEIWKAQKLFTAFDSTIKCVHFNEQQADDEDRIKELEQYFSEAAHKFKIEFYSLPTKDKVKDMNDFVEAQDIDVLVMYKPKRSFFQSIFHTSYTESMAKHTHIPLLVYKQSK